MTLGISISTYTFALFAVNYNDMTGGGDRVTRNLIFNTCRESGDHGMFHKRFP